MAQEPGEVVRVVPWADCFPTINFVLPSQPFLWLLSEPVLLLRLQTPQVLGARGQASDQGPSIV